MQIIRSELLSRFPEIIFGFSTKIGLERKTPYYFNLSFTVGDDEETVKQNRKEFFRALGLRNGNVAFQRQIHSDIIKEVNSAGLSGESDALITRTNDLGLAVSSADCTPVFIYDSVMKIIAAVHSGWRGTEKQILKKTLEKLSSEYGCSAGDLYVYVGPSVSQENYEVGDEVAALFDSDFVMKKNGELFLDVAGLNVRMLHDFGIPQSQIEVSPLCSFAEKEILHSYRRDGKISGRALGVIAMKGNWNE